MEEQLIYSAKERYSYGDEIKKINENVENIIKELGGKVINSSYILSEGIVTEAYCYYEFSGLGIITTSLIHSRHFEYSLCINLLGFKEKTEKYKRIKRDLIRALKKSGLNSVQRR
jgi:hypothetical protein